MKRGIVDLGKFEVSAGIAQLVASDLPQGITTFYDVSARLGLGGLGFHLNNHRFGWRFGLGRNDQGDIHNSRRCRWLWFIRGRSSQSASRFNNLVDNIDSFGPNVTWRIVYDHFEGLDRPLLEIYRNARIDLGWAKDAEIENRGHCAG